MPSTGNATAVFCGLPTTFKGDGDIAGPGVSLSASRRAPLTCVAQQVFGAFVATAAFTLFLAFILLCDELNQACKHTEPECMYCRPAALLSRSVCRCSRPNADLYKPRGGFAREFACNLLVGLGDTQAVTSLAFTIPALSIMADSISCYHYNLICYLSLIAGCSYASSATVVNHYSLRTASHLTWLRLLLAAGTCACTLALLIRRIGTPFPVFRQQLSLFWNTLGEHRPSTALVIPASCFLDMSRTWRKGYDTAQNITNSDWWDERKGYQRFDSSKDDFIGLYESLSTIFLLPLFIAVIITYFYDDWVARRAYKRVLKLRRIPLWNDNHLGTRQGLLTSPVPFGWLASRLDILIKRQELASGREHRHRSLRNNLGKSRRLRFLVWSFGASQFVVCTIRFKQLQKWMQLSDWLDDENETNLGTSYGQLMPLFFLILPVLNSLEKLIGKRLIPSIAQRLMVCQRTLSRTH